MTVPKFAQQVARAAAETPLAVWRAYLRQHVLDAAAPTLPSAYVNAHFDYRSRAIRGLEAQPPRAEQVIVSMTGNFGSEPLAEGLGQLYVARAFSPEAKARAVAMIEDIKSGAACAHRKTRLDERADKDARNRQARCDGVEDWISRPLENV